MLPLLWTKYVTNCLSERDLLELGKLPDQHVRRWMVRLSVDRDVPSAATLAEFHRLAVEDPSPKVRLAVAVSLQKIPLTARWSIAQALLSHAEDADDPFLPLMIWYGVEPLVETDIARALQLATDAQIPLVRRFIARRALDRQRQTDADPWPLETVVQAALHANDPTRLDYLLGMREALEGHGQIEPPSSWQRLYDQVSTTPIVESRSVAVELARIFGDRQAIAELQNTVRDQEAEITDRRSALRALLKLDKGVSAPMLHELLREPSELRTDALQALTLNHDETTPQVLLRVFADLTAVQRQSAVNVLVSRGSFIPQLLAAVRAGQVSRRDVSAYSLQQLRAYKSEQIRAAVASIWPDSAFAKDISKADEIGRFKNLLTAEFLASGNASAGRQVFADNCAKCHTLFGIGGNVGPDLTGSGRANLDYVLSNLIDPSALVDGAYRLTTIEMNDGRLLSGFLRQHDEFNVVLRTQDAEVTLKLFEIDDMQTTDRSMMPDGLLQSFTDEQIRDLVVYLASPEQVPFPLVE
jgi:putative heme-binding domain-containing protein